MKRLVTLLIVMLFISCGSSIVRTSKFPYHYHKTHISKEHKHKFIYNKNGKLKKIIHNKRYR